MDWSIILSGVSLTGVVSFIVMLIKKGKEDGQNEAETKKNFEIAKMSRDEIKDDLDRLGKKLNDHIVEDKNLISSLRLELNSMGKDVAIMKSEFSSLKESVKDIGSKIDGFGDMKRILKMVGEKMGVSL